MRNGVRVYAYPGMTHVKAAIYDGWACVGSANFDKMSLRMSARNWTSPFPTRPPWTASGANYSRRTSRVPAKSPPWSRPVGSIPSSRPLPINCKDDYFRVLRAARFFADLARL